MLECLTFAEIVGQLDGTSEVSGHAIVCPACQAICDTLCLLILDPAPDEEQFLDRIEIDILERCSALSFGCRQGADSESP